MALLPQGQGLSGTKVPKAGFVSYHFAPNARQDDDESDKCSKKNGDDDGQGGVHWEGWLGPSIEGECVSKRSHSGGVVQGRQILYKDRCLLSALCARQLLRYSRE